MGRDKALVEIDGISLLERAAITLEVAGCDPVWIAGGDPGAGRDPGRPVLADPVDAAGPLAGVSAALAAAVAIERRWAAVIAVDLPLLTPAVLAQLATFLDPELDVVVARTDRLEPAVAVWSTTALPAVERSLGSGRRALYDVVGTLRNAEVPVDAIALRNVNTPGDLAAIEGLTSHPCVRDGRETPGYPLEHGDS